MAQVLIGILIFALLSLILNTFLSILLAVILSPIIHFTFARKAWEFRVINDLPQDKRNEFYRRINLRVNALRDHVVMYDEAEKKEEILFLSCLQSLTGDLSEDEIDEALEIFRSYNQGNLDFMDRNLIKKLDGMYHKKYADYYKDFYSYNYKDIVGSIPFPRMYKLTMKKFFFPVYSEVLGRSSRDMTNQ